LFAIFFKLFFLKELLKKVFSEQLIYPKVEIIRDGERSISSYSLIKKDVNDKFVESNFT
jgi:hypothetical protein